MGFAVPPPLPDARCALTAPFHPYRGRTRGGLISVALSLGSPPPDVIRHRVSVEPGLSSAPRGVTRPSGRLADQHMRERSVRVKCAGAKGTGGAGGVGHAQLIRPRHRRAPAMPDQFEAMMVRALLQ
ncbi:hypothetical protein GCM10017643_05050 [Ancylobacter dichloromethanicus]|uniref:Uncharacterized protein n=1 Tax=Ancylobacter dichloromethanicus TaxID=518825 RepID=A0A9W6MXY5_9HYPH|nr:hypothetical protein GCM10017643_05050 [Ancylobacter dichloromethanicus]